MRSIITLVIIFFFNVHHIDAQANVVSENQDNILYQLEWLLESGNARYLRDVASFLDDEINGQKALKILSNNSLFPEDKIDLRTNPGKDAFYNFYYENESSIKYSHLMNVFHLGDLENLQVNDHVRKVEIQNPNERINEFSIMLKSNKLEANALKFQIIKLQKHYGFLFNNLFNTILAENEILNENTLDINNIVYIYPEKDFIENIKNHKIKGLTAKSFGFELSDLPNEMQDSIVHMISKKTDPNVIKKYYLENHFNSKESFYYSEVDFYGTLLSNSIEKGNSESIISSLLKTHDPKLLYYLSIFNFHLSKKENDLDLEELMTNLSQTKIEGVSDLDRAKNYMIHWMNNFQDYEWDDHFQRYLSKEERNEKTKNLEKLFRRLNSKNDSVAIASYVQLTEVDPHILERMLSKYRNILTKINPKIPSLKYNYLETLSQLVSLCRENDYTYNTDIKLNSLLADLKIQTEQKQRYLLENKILEALNSKNISSVEYWAVLNSKSKVNTYSAGRILDIFYSRNWEKILNDHLLFRNYIKTALIFNNMDGAGSCKNYYKKFNLHDNKFKSNIQILKENTFDPILLEGLEELIAKRENDEYIVFKNKEEDTKKLLYDLTSKESITYESFNKLIDDDNLFLEQKDEILNLIEKIEPQKDIRKLALKESINFEDSKYFDNGEYSVKELASMIRFFKGDEPQKTIRFFLNKSRNFDLEDRAYIANNFFRNQWFLRFLDSTNSISQECQDIMVTLTDYLMTSEYISEIEDRNTQLNIILISMIGKELRERMELSVAIDIDQATRADLQKNILAKISYEDISIILDFIDGLIDKNGNSDISFLNKDFGIPIFKFESVKQINLMRKRHQSMSQKEFYIAYLKDFGVDFLLKKHKLDYKKIVEILNYDITYRFVGRGGGHRDYYVYAIIKILEMEFGTSLGYNEKLNEFQTFYKYTSNGRAKDWINYLIKNGYLESYKLVPSFYN